MLPSMSLTKPRPACPDLTVLSPQRSGRLTLRIGRIDQPHRSPASIARIDRQWVSPTNHHRMKLLKTASQAHQFVSGLRRDGHSVALVPTMGALHEGHLSLVHAGRQRCNATIATIFVNPTQFAPGEDLAQYPRTLESDLAALEAAGCSGVFVPEVAELYPPGCTASVNPPQIARPLEGAFRPTHFQGVATIVLKLFHILPASHALFGQKDLQQLRVIEAMVRDLNVAIEIVGCPIVREPDGLAMSSRNRYLGECERRRALRLSVALGEAERAIRDGQRESATLEAIMRSELKVNHAGEGVDSIDYAVAVDSQTLAPVDRLAGEVALLIAAHVGGTRLIDNRLVHVP